MAKKMRASCVAARNGEYPSRPLFKLKTLVMMQLKDKLDLSFVRSVRSVILTSVVAVIKFAVAVALFFVLFWVCNLLTVFRPTGFIPDSVVNILFTLIQLMSIITCTVGITKALYMTADNKVLLTLPVNSTTVFVSKLILYYIFELKKNLSLTLPVFVAYGIVNGAVWYYYPWLLFCFVFVSLVPVAIGALASIPALYVGIFVGRFKWLQCALTLCGAAAVTWGVVSLIQSIPQNINILGQWGSITVEIQNFLTAFSRYSYPYYKMTLMMVGGTLRIGANPVGGDTFAYLGVLLAVLAVLLPASFLIAKPLFVKMASRQFEFEKKQVKAKPNRKFNAKISPFAEYLQRNFRSSTFVINLFVQLVLPAIAILLQNKLYAAMNTNYSGITMTKAFSLLVMLVMTLAFNNRYATIYSSEAAARNIVKTRPQLPIYTLAGRIALRSVTILVSTLAVTLTYSATARQVVDGNVIYTVPASEIWLMGLITLLVGQAHLLWCADIDIMHNCAEQFQTVGMQYDSANERNATVIGFALAAAFAFLFYFLTQNSRAVYSLLKGLCIAAALAGARAYLFVTRAKLYFAED